MAVTPEFKVNAAQVAQYIEGNNGYSGTPPNTPLGTVAPSVPGTYPITFPRS